MNMNDSTNCTTPSQSAIARALGIAKSRITALKQRGMPTHSIEAARAWRQENLNPARTKDFMRLAMASSPHASNELPLMVRQAITLAENAADALEAGVFWAAVPRLQFAMKCLSRAEREQFAMPVVVWDELTREMAASLAANTAAMGNPPEHFLKPDEPVSDYVENFWFEVAAGIVVCNDDESLPVGGAARSPATV
jgi:hypothetical protein